MKKLKQIFALLCYSMLIYSCNKSESIVNGNISYIGAVSGIEYSAKNSVINLYAGAVGQTGSVYASTITDENGYYIFESLPDGNWTISASITVNSFYYYGESNLVQTNGSNVVTENFKLVN